MSERKIQRVGAGSYSVSLPIDWVKKNHLKEQNVIFFEELEDGSLCLSPSKTSLKNPFQKFLLKAEDYGQNISQILYAVYYLGAEQIIVYSDKEFSQETISLIKKAIFFMSGTVISFEDSKRIEISVLLDASKVNANNILYRIGIIVQSSLKNCLQKIDLEEINRNENEVDRLFHLVSKIIIISSNDMQILKTSGIKSKFFLAPYLIISKKLENIADEAEEIAIHLAKSKQKPDDFKEIILDIQGLIEKCQSFFSKQKNFELSMSSNQQKIEKEKNFDTINDFEIRQRIKTIYRYIYDIEEELVNIKFFNNMLNQKSGL